MAVIPKTRGFLERWLVGKYAPFKATARDKSLVFDTPGKSSLYHQGSTISNKGRDINYFKFQDSAGNKKYVAHEGDLPDLKAMPDADRIKFLDDMEAKGTLSNAEVSRFKKERNASRDAIANTSVRGIARNLGITGGALGAMANNPGTTAATAGVLTLAGLAGKNTYNSNNDQNVYRPSSWGVGENTSIKGTLGLDKQSHLESFLEKKAIGIAPYLAADAATEMLNSGGERGLTGGLSYSLATKILPLSTRIQLPDTMAEAFVSNFSSDAGKEAFGALNRSMKSLFGRIKERNVDVPARRAILQSIRNSDMILKNIPEDSLKSWYNTLASYAPTISLDKNLVTSFLKQVAQYDGQIDYGKLQELMKLEESFQKVHMKEGFK